MKILPQDDPRTPAQKLFNVKKKLNELRRNAESLAAMGSNHVRQLGVISLQLLDEIDRELE